MGQSSVTLSRELQNLLNASYERALTLRHELLTPEHFLAAALGHDEIVAILEDCEVDVEQVKSKTDAYLADSVPKSEDGEPVQSAMFKRMLQRAILHVDHVGRDSVEIHDILVSLFEEQQSSAAFFLQEGGLSRYSLLRRISHEGLDPQGGFPDNDLYGLGQFRDDAGVVAEPHDVGDSALGDHEQGQKNDSDKEENQIKSRQKLLERYTTNLTQLAEEGKLDPLIGRKELLDRTMHVLGRRLKNNPLHVGDPGVGKTSLTEGLAARIVAGDVPYFLKGYSVYSLDITGLLAGTRFRGDFEERMKQLIGVLQKEEKVIVFIDEIHTIVGAGAGSGHSLDASNMLKPLLASGQVRCIGSTTHEEYRRYFEKDRALTRRFQRIDVPELSEADTVAVVKGLRAHYEAYHQVYYSDEVLELATKLAAQYINDRYLPDKAIDVMDECGAAFKMRHGDSGITDKADTGTQGDSSPAGGKSDAPGSAVADGTAGETQAPPISTQIIDKSRTISAELVEEVVARIAQIPRKSINKSEQKQLRDIEKELSKRIFGQPDAVSVVAQAIKRGRAGFRASNKPVASFLFVGPTGVGKTELARQLAGLLGVELLRFDMSEYQERHTMSRLIGSPPGYVGYDEGAQLTDSVRKSPHSVLLLDEIEKAHHDIQHILLQVMDYATVTDNTGRKADFRNVVLIMTSNAGARDIGKQMVGFEGKSLHHEATKTAVEQLFTPEFRGRIDQVVNFNSLNISIIESIISREIGLFNTQLAERGVQVRLTTRALRALAREAGEVDAGARAVQRLVEMRIRSWFVDEVLFGSLAVGGNVSVDYIKNEYRFTVKSGAQA